MHTTLDPEPGLVRRTLPTVLFVVRTASGALGRHPMRAGLTMVGIAVGVAAVIALVSLGEGAKQMVMLTLLGGVAGVALGIAASHLTARSLDWPSAISLTTIGLGLCISTLVGLLFGYYPAAHASGLDPIEALRFE